MMNGEIILHHIMQMSIFWGSTAGLPPRSTSKLELKHSAELVNYNHSKQCISVSSSCVSLNASNCHTLKFHDSLSNLLRVSFLQNLLNLIKVI